MKINGINLDCYKIVVPTIKDSALSLAVQELQEHLHKYFGILLEVCDETIENAFEIVLGACARRESTFLPTQGLKKDDGFCIRTFSSKICICGKTTEGTLYGVYHLLNHIGIDWLQNGEDMIEIDDSLDLVYNIDYDFAAQIRIAFSGTTWKNNRWRLRQRLHYAVGEYSGEYGKPEGENAINTVEYAFRDGMYGHTFEVLLPFQKYYKEHPEYYSFSSKYPADSYKWQICLTNPNVYEIVLQNVLAYLREHPTCEILSVSQNDSYGDFVDNFCMCEKCREKLRVEGSYSGVLLGFVNRIAEEVEKEFPNVWIHTFCYTKTLQPPKYEKPRKNVIVQHCLNKSYNRSYMHPKKDERTLICKGYFDTWRENSTNVHTWTYLCNFSNYFVPLGNFKSLYEDTVYMLRRGVYGIFQQGVGDDFPFEFAGLRTYLIAKLFQNPFMSYEEYLRYIRKYLRAYYGETAEPYLFDYIMLLQDLCDEAPPAVGAWGTGDARQLLNETFISKGKRLWAKAVKVAENEEKKQRIVYSKKHFDFCQLILMYAEIKDEKTRKVYARKRKEFIKSTFAYKGVLHYGEGKVLYSLVNFDYESDPFVFQTKDKSVRLSEEKFSPKKHAVANSNEKITDIDFTFKAKKEGECIRLKVDVKDVDPTHVKNHNLEDWAQDAVEIYFSETLHKTNPVQYGDFLIRVNADGNYKTMLTDERVRSFSFSKNADGYSFDICIWFGAGMLKKGNRIGMEIVAHNFSDNGYVNTRYWNSVKGSIMAAFPRLCGILEMN